MNGYQTWPLTKDSQKDGFVSKKKGEKNVGPETDR